MGRPEGDSSETPSYDQPDLGTAPAATYYDPTQEDYNYTQPPPINEPQQPPPPPPPQQQHETFSRAPMQNPPPAHFPQPPPGPVLFPPPSPQMNHTAPTPQPAAYLPTQPAAYPPPPTVFPPLQNPPPPAAYPPQKPAVSFPPPPPQHAQQYPPPPPQVNIHPVQFPPPGNPQAGYQMPPQSPMKPAAQGIPVQMAVPNSEGWRTGLFDCMEDPMNAVITFLFPCLTFGQIAEIIDNGQTTCATGAILYALIGSFVGMPCIYSCTYRTKLRNRFGLVEAPAPDWAVHFLCEACALCQAYRELNHRGFDPSLGWMGNVARNQQHPQMPMMPPAPQRMM